MPSVMQSLQGAFGGAETGFSLSGGNPWAIGAGALAGFAGSLFDESPDDERAKRYKQLIDELAQQERESLMEGTGVIEGQTTRRMASAGQGGARLARSLGRADQTTAFQLPEQQAIAAAGSESVANYTTGVQREFAGARARAAENYADRPIEPGVSDILGLIGNSAMRFRQNKDLISTMKQDVPGGRPNMNIGMTDTSFGKPETSLGSIMKSGGPSVEETAPDYGQFGGYGPSKSVAGYKPKKKSAWNYLNDLVPYDASGLLSGVYN